MAVLCYHCLKGYVDNGRCSVCGKAPIQANEYDKDILPPGTLLDGGNVVIGIPIGRGGFGITYIALDRKDGNNKRVALKEFVPRHMVTRRGRELLVNESYQEEFDKSMRAFRREARTLHELRGHENVVKVFFEFEENNTVYYAMELLEGVSFKQWLKERGSTLSAQEAFELLDPIMETLDEIHRVGVMHRDVGPGNIFLCDNPDDPAHPMPKLIDFGAAYVAMSHFTHSFALTKTDGYSPIEQLLWDIKEQGAWTDVYAFCATFYYAITGRAPVASNLRYIDGVQLAAPSTLGADISRETEAVLLEGLAVRPDNRIRDMATLRRRLARSFKPASVPMGKRVLGGLLEAVLFYGLGQVVAPGAVGLLCSFLCMALLDAVLCFASGGGTLGQRIVGLCLEDEQGNSPSLKASLIFSLSYAIAPLALVDCLVHGEDGVTARDTLAGLRVREKEHHREG